MVADYSQFEDQAKRMRDELVRVATEEANRWLETTLSVPHRLSGSIPSYPMVEMDGSTHGREESSASNGTLANQFDAALAAISKRRFSTADVRQWIETRYGYTMSPTQRANLANLLRRRVKKGELVLVTKGKGSRPSIYRKQVDD